MFYQIMIKILRRPNAFHPNNLTISFLGLSILICLNVENLMSHDLNGLVTEYKVLSEEVIERIEAEKTLRVSLPPIYKSLSESQKSKPLEYIFQSTAMWRPGKTLIVCFFNGDQNARKRVAEIAGYAPKAGQPVVDRVL